MASLLRWAAAFDALSLRERLLILVTAVVAVALPAVMYGIDPTVKAQTQQKTRVAKLKADNANRKLELLTLRSQQRVDPNDALKARQAALEQQLAALNRDLQTRSAQLLSPPEMLAVLQQALAEQPGLRLVALTKAPAQRYQSDGEGSVAGIYRHDLVLTLEGGYFDVLRYLKKLEQLPKGFFWDGLDYQVDGYPHAQVTLRLHTLSTEEGWLGV